jgi:molybdate transport system permease protein
MRLDQAWYILAVPMLALILLPLIALILRAPGSRLVPILLQPEVLQAMRLSVLTSLTAVVVTIVAGTPVAYLLSQPGFRLQQVVDTLVDLPTVLPPAVAGLALLMALGRRGLMGGWLADMGISIPFTSVAVILAQTFVAAPFYIKSAALGFSSISQDLRQAAALDGAGTWQIFRYIVVPLSWVSIVTGCAMTWARALGEFGATIIFAGNFPGRTQTMPLAIYLGFETSLDNALALSLILIVLSVLILTLVKVLLRWGLSPEPIDF